MGNQGSLSRVEVAIGGKGPLFSSLLSEISFTECGKHVSETLLSTGECKNAIKTNKYGIAETTKRHQKETIDDWKRSFIS